MKKLILAILFAAFFSLGTALAVPCFYGGCAAICQAEGVPVIAGYPDFWHTTGDPSPATCCTTSECVQLCTGYDPESAAGVTTSSPNTDAPTDQDFLITIIVGPTIAPTNDWTLKIEFPWQTSPGMCPDITVTNNGDTDIYGTGVDPNDPNGCISTTILPQLGTRYTGGSVLQPGGSENLEISIPAAGSSEGQHTILVESSQSGTGVNANTLPVGVSYIFPSGLNPSYTIYQLVGGVPTAITANWIPNITTMYIGNSVFGSEMAFKIDPSALTSGATTWSLSTFTIDEDSTGPGTTIAESGINLFPTATKLLLMEAGDVPYGICCPIANTRSEVTLEPTACQQMYVTYNTLTINGVKYYTCTGTGTGGTTQGDTNLTINDSAEGGSVDTGVAVNFYAYFYNKTVGVGDTSLDDINSNCTVNEDGANHTMTYNSTQKRWNWTDSSGYATAGTKEWIVWCDTNATGHVGLTINDSIDITTAASVPEFSDLAWILAAVLGAGSFVLLRKKFN